MRDMQKDFRSQEGMETVLAAAFRSLRDKGADTINEMFAGTLVSCSFADMTCVTAFEMPQWMKNEYGFIHGGATAAAFDNATGVFAWFAGEGRDTQTISLQVSYLRAAPVGRRLMVRSRLTKRGRRIMYVSAEAWSEGDEARLTATAEGVFNVAPEDGGTYGV
jgi:acyl-coenzyme A thioesterase PaaI-like protein